MAGKELCSACRDKLKIMLLIPSVSLPRFTKLAPAKQSKAKQCIEYVGRQEASAS